MTAAWTGHEPCVFPPGDERAQVHLSGLCREGRHHVCGDPEGFVGLTCECPCHAEEGGTDEVIAGAAG